jgi:hypothetical protein
MSKQDAFTEQGRMNMTSFLAGSSNILLSSHVNHDRDPRLTSLEFLLQTLEQVEHILGDDDNGYWGTGEGLSFPMSTSTKGSNQCTREQQDQHTASKQ